MLRPLYNLSPNDRLGFTGDMYRAITRFTTDLVFGSQGHLRICRSFQGNDAERGKNYQLDILEPRDALMELP
jgi:hypothetical protein